jgi:TatD DNase family protein
MGEGYPLPALLDSCLEHGLSRIVHVSTTIEEHVLIEPFLAGYPDFLSLALGVMAGPAPEKIGFTMEKISQSVEKRQICAIGEIGLDYYRMPAPPDEQQRVFGLQAALALETGLPVVIHTRDAAGDTLAVLDRFPGLRGVVHCFSGDLELAEAFLRRGFFISFSGVLTYRNALALQEAARRLPMEKILVETDCPYLAPVPMRGKPNLPWYVRYTADFLAGLRGIPSEAVAQATAANAAELFGW